MSGSVRTLLKLGGAYVFASGQGEFTNLNQSQARARLARIHAVFQAVGLDEALRGLVPPAWLLSFIRLARSAKACTSHPSAIPSPVQDHPTGPTRRSRRLRAAAALGERRVGARDHR